MSKGRYSNGCPPSTRSDIRQSPQGSQSSMKKTRAAQSLLSTTTVSSSGAVNNTSSEPVRFSSLKSRMVNKGTASMKQKTGNSESKYSVTMGSGTGKPIMAARDTSLINTPNRTAATMVKLTSTK